MDVTTTSTKVGKFDARFFDLVFEEEFGRVKGHFGPINSLAFHPNGEGFGYLSHEITSHFLAFIDVFAFAGTAAGEKTDMCACTFSTQTTKTSYLNINLYSDMCNNKVFSVVYLK